MAEQILDLIETVSNELATEQKLFAGEGQAVNTSNKPASAQYKARLVETAVLVNDILHGNKPGWALREAMSTSDFPYLFGDVIDRLMLGTYNSFPSNWQNWLKRETVRDFRTVQRHYIDGAQGVLSEVAEGAEYPASSLSEGEYTYAVKKYGRTIPFTWETLINDDLGAFNDMVQRLGTAAARSVAKFATDLYCDANGPDATFFSSGHNNIATSNPALSIAGLQTAMSKLAAQTDTDGEPIYIEALELVVPPALEITAQNIINATQIEVTGGSAIGTQSIYAQNWMRSRVRLNVDPYIPIIATSNGTTSWFLFASTSVGRPAGTVGFLRGHEAPEIFVKTPNAQRVGGGINPMDGDFDTDSITYKLRHVYGGVMMDYRMAVSSNGTGS